MRTFITFFTLAVAIQSCLAEPYLIPDYMVGPQPNTRENVLKFQHLKSTDDPKDLSGQFQGDIILTKEQLDYINELQVNPNTVMIDPTKHWPNNVVPYAIEGEFSASDVEEIENALYNMEHFTCFKFVERTSEEDYIAVEKPDSTCSSSVGFVGGRQVLKLASPGCISFATIVHEFMHAIGFKHMQSASDRDNYVRIEWDNIPEDKKHNFVITSAEEYSQFGLPYDFTSIMHYREDAFAIDKTKPTIVSLNGEKIRPHEDSWSWYDVERIERAFCQNGTANYQFNKELSNLAVPIVSRNV